MIQPKADVFVYKPPPTVREFISHYKPGELFFDWIEGPVGSAKTTGNFFKLCRLAALQEPQADGIRRTRCVIVRNTYPMLRDTTLKSWQQWFKDDEAGEWLATQNTFILRFDDVECEVLFRPLDTPDDVNRVLSLEVTFAIIDEFVNIPKAIIESLSGRCGRYPSAKDGGATNWGMWGASNTDTEDNWWFDHLHAEDRVRLHEYDQWTKGQVWQVNANTKLFVQPSGFSPDAENLENLPGGAAYYTNLAVGKSVAWIKQFIEVEWGFSIAGTPVVPTFRAELHVSKVPLVWNPGLMMVVGLDPGIGGLAAIFMQEDLIGRLLVYGEVIAKGYGAKRFISEKLKPYIRRRFPGCERITIAPDPAAANRSANDEKTIVDTFREEYDVSIESNNRLPLRLDAIDHYTTRLVEGKPALLIDGAECPILVRALKGGWRYALNPKNEEMKGSEPEKNQYSHPGDGFGYGARFFVREGDVLAKMERIKQSRRTRPVNRGSAYHYR